MSTPPTKQKLEAMGRAMRGMNDEIDRLRDALRASQAGAAVRKVDYQISMSHPGGPEAYQLPSTVNYSGCCSTPEQVSDLIARSRKLGYGNFRVVKITEEDVGLTEK